MHTKLSLLACALMVTPVAAQLEISLGVRETGAAGGSFTAIGDNGGFSGAIEWVNLDGQTLNLDGTWQTFTFNFATDTLTGFTGNGAVDGDFGTLEHIRIRNTGGVAGNIALWIDDIVNTTDAGASTVADFESTADGAEDVFQEPSFSGSTGGNVLTGSDSSGVTSAIANSGSKSFRCDWEYTDTTDTRWVRLTTFQTPNTPNPLIRFDMNSVITIAIRGLNCDPGSATVSAGCPPGLHSLGGPVIGVEGSPGIGTDFNITADNVFGSITALFLGSEIAPIPLSILSPVPGASLCITPVVLSIPYSGSSPASITIPLSDDPFLCGTAIDCQWLDLDVTIGNLALGSSEVLNIVVGS